MPSAWWSAFPGPFPLLVVVLLVICMTAVRGATEVYCMLRPGAL